MTNEDQLPNKLIDQNNEEFKPFISVYPKFLLTFWVGGVLYVIFGVLFDEHSKLILSISMSGVFIAASLATFIRKIIPSPEAIEALHGLKLGLVRLGIMLVAILGSGAIALPFLALINMFSVYR